MEIPKPRTGNPAHDPFSIFPRIAGRLRTAWLKATYPFQQFGTGVSIHHSCVMSRPGARSIRIGNEVYLAPDVWLNIVGDYDDANAKIVIGAGSKIGRRT